MFALSVRSDCILLIALKSLKRLKPNLNLSDKKNYFDESATATSPRLGNRSFPAYSFSGTPALLCGICSVGTEWWHGFCLLWSSLRVFGLKMASNL